MINVARDYEGLRRAALEYFAEGLAAERQRRMLALAGTAANRDELLRSESPARTLSDGYYTRVEYLLQLRQMIECGVQFQPEKLRVSELRGMAAVESARREFLREHPSCPKCGSLAERHDVACVNCGARFQGAA